MNSLSIKERLKKLQVIQLLLPLCRKLFFAIHDIYRLPFKIVWRYLLIRIKPFRVLYPTLSEKVILQSSEKVNTKDLASLKLHPDHHCLLNDYYTSEPLKILSVKNAIYSPKYGFCLHPSRALIAETVPRILQQSFWQNPFGPWWNWRDFYDGDVEILAGLSTLYRSAYNGVFGHQLLNDLPRLCLLHRACLSPTDDIRIPYVPPLSELESYLLPKILPDGVDLYPIKKDKLYWMKNYWHLSFPGNMYAPYIPKIFLEEYLAYFLPARPSLRPGHRLYISRQQHVHRPMGRHILNEDDLMKQLEPLGFQLCLPENLSIQEQVDLFYDAEIIVATYGSALTLTIFSYQAKILVLSPSPTISPYFYFIAKSRQHQLEHWYGDLEYLHNNYYVNIEEAVSLLKCLIAN